jgi:cytochrome b561
MITIIIIIMTTIIRSGRSLVSCPMHPLTPKSTVFTYIHIYVHIYIYTFINIIITITIIIIIRSGRSLVPGPMDPLTPKSTGGLFFIYTYLHI